MKKILILTALLLCGAVFAQQQEPAAKTADQSQISVSLKEKEEKLAKEQPWEFISLTFIPGVSSSPDFADVYGVRLGAPVSFGDFSTVNGVEAALLICMSSKVNGIQASPLLNIADTVNGLQASTIANKAKNVHGLQFGIVNIAEGKTFQIGLVNIIKDGLLPFTLLVNFRF